MFESLNNKIVEMMGPLGPLLLVGGLGIVLIVITLPVFLKKRADSFDRLKGMAAASGAGTQKRDGGKKLRQGMSHADKLERFASFLEPQDTKTMNATRMHLLRAGYPSKNSVRLYHFAKFALGVIFLLLGLVYTLVKNSGSDVPPDLQSMMMTTLVPGAIGYYFPIYWVNKRVKARQSEIVDGFPDALDMMLVCVEAGQSLDQTINRVHKELKTGYPTLAEEFETISNEVKAGKERIAVLKDMAERVDVPDVSSFVTTLVQSATFGTSVAEALRVYSSEMRDKRVMRAEEKANKLPTKLTLGTMMFTVPPLLIILIGPSVYSIGSTLALMQNG